MKEPHHPALLIGIDIGGTFTDFVIHDNATGQVITSKVLSTPADPSQAVISGLRDLLENLKLSNPSPAVSASFHGM